MVLYETQLKRPRLPSLFLLYFKKLDTFSYNPHSRADPSTTKHENILSEGRRGA